MSSACVVFIQAGPTCRCKWVVSGIHKPCTRGLSGQQLLTGTSLQVQVDVPDVKGRTEILKVHARNKKLAEDVSIEEIAQRTPGFSGADLANLLNEVCWLCMTLLHWHKLPACTGAPLLLAERIDPCTSSLYAIAARHSR